MQPRIAFDLISILWKPEGKVTTHHRVAAQVLLGRCFVGSEGAYPACY